MGKNVILLNRIQNPDANGPNYAEMSDSRPDFQSIPVCSSPVASSEYFWFNTWPQD